MTTPLITGSFFDFQHVNLWDAAYWTDQCRFWNERQWRALVADMHDIGITTIISTGTALWGRPVFPGSEKTVGLPLRMGCRDPVAAVMDEADRLGMEVFLGVGMRGRVSQVRDYADMSPPWPDVWFSWNAALAEALLMRYGDRSSFRGLYISYEIDFQEYHVQLYDELIGRRLRPVIGSIPLLASPGSLGNHPHPERLEKDLTTMGIDILACQDYGGRSTDPEAALDKVRRNADALQRHGDAARNAGVEIWTNCELFDFEPGPDGRHRCIAGPMERIKRQIQIQSPLVDKVICYQYQGIMNRRTELVDIGTPASERLYDEYAAYRRSIIDR